MYDGKPPTVAAVATDATKEPAPKDPTNTNVSKDNKNVDPNVQMLYQNLSVGNVNSRPRPPDVSEDMKAMTDRLALESLTLQPNNIWLRAKRAMDALHGNSTGEKRNYIVARVRRARANMNYDDTFRTIENSKYHQMTDSDQYFLQKNEVFPNTTDGGWQRIMVFVNPAAISTNLEIGRAS